METSRLLSGRAFILAVAMVLAGNVRALAHETHKSVAEVEWNARSACFEVALRVPAADLADALSLKTGQRVNLEQTADIEPVLVRYVRRNFAIGFGDQPAKADRRLTPLNWVGYEIELHDVWMYFEVPAPGARPPEESVIRRPRSGLRSAPDKSKPVASSSSQRSGLRSPVHVRNTMLFDVRSDQINVVELKRGRLVADSHHDRKTPDAELDLTGMTTGQAPAETR